MKARIKFIALLALAVSVFLPVSLTAQSVIYEHHGAQAEYSILKNYRENIDIKYEIWPVSRFDYIDRGTNTVHSFELTWVRVTDFTILGDKVYFCGIHFFDVQRCAVIGWFPIDSAFFYSGNIHYYDVPFTYPYHTDTNIFNVGLSRIDVVKENAYTHIYLTGEADWSATSKAPIQASLLADAVLTTGTTGLSFNHTIDFSGELTYVDVAILNNYMVVAGIRNSQRPEHFHIPYKRPKQNTASQTIFSMAPTLPTGELIPDIYWTDYSLLTCRVTDVLAMEDNSFATIATYYEDSSCVFSFYSTPYISPYQRFGFRPEAFGMGGASYNPVSNVIGVCRMATPYIYYVPVPCSVVTQVWTDQRYRWRSIDRVLSLRSFVVSGFINGTLGDRLWIYDSKYTSDCVTSRDVQIQDIPRTQQHNVKIQDYFMRPLDLENNPVHSWESRLNIECE